MNLYAICSLDMLPSRRACGFVLARRRADGSEAPWPIVVIRWGRHLLAYENRCPHDGVPLDWERGQFLDDTGTRIACGKHGALFDLGTGTCVDGPCLGESLTALPLVLDGEDVCLAGVDLIEEGPGAG